MLFFSFLLVFASCSKDEEVIIRQVKPEIKILKLVSDQSEGTIDKTAKTISFSVAFSFDLTSVKFSGNYSQKGVLTKEEYDFSENLTQTIRVQIPETDLYNDYNVTIKVLPEPKFGADFTKAVEYDFTKKTAIFPDFTGSMTRSADFNGKSVLIVSRNGGIKPKVLSLANIKENKPENALVLNIEGIKDGTYPISAGRFVDDHIYICNLSLRKAAPLFEKFKIYHWANETSAPELIFETDRGELGLGESTDDTECRFGDNLSVDIDKDGNGYIFAVNNKGTIMLKIPVSGYTKTSSPELKAIFPKQDIYTSVNRIPETQNYVLSATRFDGAIIDINGLQQCQISNPNLPAQAGDIRIFEYNNARYLISSTGRWSGQAVQQLLVFDISQGNNAIEAVELMAETKNAPVYSYTLLDGAATSAAAAFTNWKIIDNELYLFTAATDAGFAIIKFPTK